MARDVNAVNLLQELPKLRRDRNGLEYDLNGLALSYIRSKVDEIDGRLAALEELLSAVYVRLDEIGSRSVPAACPDPVARGCDGTRDGKSSSAGGPRRPLVDSLDGTFVPSRLALAEVAGSDQAREDEDDESPIQGLSWWRRLYIRLFHPERLRRQR